MCRLIRFYPANMAGFSSTHCGCFVYLIMNINAVTQKTKGKYERRHGKFALSIKHEQGESSIMSQVKKGSWVKIIYTGKLKDGTVFETNIGSAPLDFKVGKGKVIKGFENAVLGMKAGETKTVTIKPADGYGAKDQDLIWIVASAELPAGTAPTLETEVAFTRPDGTEVEGRITKIEEDQVTIDGNHPLAGRQLIFEIKMLEVK